jgi:hypothetical protein
VTLFPFQDSVMAGRSPGHPRITEAEKKKDVDGWHKAGHDEGRTEQKTTPATPRQSP